MKTLLFLILSNILFSSKIRAQTVPYWLTEERDYLIERLKQYTDTTSYEYGHDDLTKEERAIKIKELKYELDSTNEEIVKYIQNQKLQHQKWQSFQNQFNHFTAVEIEDLKLNKPYTNVRLTKDGETLPVITIITKYGYGNYLFKLDFLDGTNGFMTTRDKKYLYFASK